MNKRYFRRLREIFQVYLFLINFITFKILAEEIKEENLFEKTKFTGEMMNFFYGSQFYENAAAERYIGNREGSVEIQKDENRMKARLQILCKFSVTY